MKAKCKVGLTQEDVRAKTPIRPKRKYGAGDEKEIAKAKRAGK